MRHLKKGRNGGTTSRSCGPVMAIGCYSSGWLRRNGGTTSRSCGPLCEARLPVEVVTAAMEARPHGRADPVLPDADNPRLAGAAMEARPHGRADSSSVQTWRRWRGTPQWRHDLTVVRTAAVMMVGFVKAKSPQWRHDLTVVRTWPSLRPGASTVQVPQWRHDLTVVRTGVEATIFRAIYSPQWRHDLTVVRTRRLHPAEHLSLGAAMEARPHGRADEQAQWMGALWPHHAAMEARPHGRADPGCCGARRPGSGAAMEARPHGRADGLGAPIGEQAVEAAAMEARPHGRADRSQIVNLLSCTNKARCERSTGGDAERRFFSCQRSRSGRGSGCERSPDKIEARDRSQRLITQSWVHRYLEAEEPRR